MDTGMPLQLPLLSLLSFKIFFIDTKLIYDALKILQHYFKIVSLQNKMDTPLHGIVVNFKFRNFVCEGQLCYSEAVTTKEKNLESIRHFLFDMEAEKYSSMLYYLLEKKKREYKLQKKKH